MELVVSITALTSGLYELVVIVAGAVITNRLLMLGIGPVGRTTGTARTHPCQQHRLQARHDLSLLLLAIPTIISLERD